MEEKSKPVSQFHLGICMAGAVSAGAYTAGVMDYLLEALEAYESQRSAGVAGVPRHQVIIPVIGGASAGGMTSMITAAALQQGITPVDQPAADPIADRPENMLYHSWVDLTDRDMFSKMLENDDIKDGIVSALNCGFIDQVADRTITPENSSQIAWKELPSFFPQRLKLFTTLSNLEGYTYDVTFKSAASNQHNPYYMQFHNDYACFEMVRDGIAPSAPGWMQLDIKAGLNAVAAKQAAMATGAFPVGLKARVVQRSSNTAALNPFFDKETREAIRVEQDPYVSLNVDGGMINNEPFDKVRELLIAESGQSQSEDYESYKKFNSTVLMIAPFPSKKPKAITLIDKLSNVVGLTLSAMISQMRYKPSQLKNAMDSDCAGQFLIDPSRTIIKPDGEKFTIQGERAIACGALGGFSGFLNKEFRVHDYFLGRHNCKIFLKEYFTIPDDAKNANPIFSAGYEGITSDKYRAKDGSWQIIPIVDDDVDYNFPVLNFTNSKSWPKQHWEVINKYNDPLKKRCAAIIMNLVKYKPLVRVFLWIGTRILLRGMIAKAAMKTVKEELTAWDLLI